MRRRVASVAVLGVAVLLAASAPSSRADTVAEQLDPAHTGVSAQGLGPPLRERWRRTFDASVPIRHLVRWPLVVGNRVFVTFDRSDGPREVHALDAATGATLWMQTVADVPIGTAYSAGKVLVGTRSALYAFDAATGAKAWERREWPGGFGASLDSAPVAADGVVYVGAKLAVYAVDVVTNTVKWHTDGLWAFGLAVGADRVFVNTNTGLVALRRSDGGVAWRGPENSTLPDTKPTVAGGRVYVPSRYDGAVYDASTGALLRRRFWMDPMVAVDSTRAYVRSGVSAEDESILEVVDVATGATRWEFGAWNGLTSYPLVAGEQVYVVGKGGVLYALDRSTGAVTWCGRTNTANYAGEGHTIALGAGLMLLPVGGELVALEPGGTPGCRFYETTLPAYAAPIGEDRAATDAQQRTAPTGFVRSGDGLTARSGEQLVSVDRRGARLGAAGAPGSVRLRVRGGRPARSVQPEGPLPGVVNVYAGRDRSRWRAGLKRYGRVRLRGVKPGVDLLVREAERRFAYDLVLAPGVDPRTVVLEFRGARGIAVGRDGELLVRTDAGTIRQRPPVAYQRVRGAPRRVPARFRLTGDGGVGFHVGRYDRARSLVIDPTLEWATHVGGGVDDEANAVATDPAGNVYVAGRTASRDLAPAGAVDGWDERNAICEDFPPCYDAWAAKYAPDGSLVYLTYLSGRRDEAAQAVAADAAGNAYVAGFTISPNFPVRSALQDEWRCGFSYGDAFVTKLSPDGTALVYSTFLGGCGSFGDIARGIAVDPQGRAVVAGETDAFDFPTTAGAADRVCAPQEPNSFCRDAFVARLSASGSTLEWSTFFGGDESDEIPFDVELDEQARPVIVGETAPWASDDFPDTPGSYRSGAESGIDLFAARLAADGSALQWAAEFGGVDYDIGADAALDAAGDVHIAGTTESRDFPTTAGAFDRVCNTVVDEWSCTNAWDAFALELSADGSSLLASTFVGGAGYERGGGIAVDAEGRAYVAGGSASDRGFPLVDPFQADARYEYDWCAARTDCSDAFIVRLDAAKSRVEYGSLHGGLGHDLAMGVALAAGDAWIAGFTQSPDLASTAGAPQARWAGGNCSFMRGSLGFPGCADGFVARIDAARPPAPPPPPGDDGGGTGDGGAAPPGTGAAGATPAPDDSAARPGDVAVRRVARTLTVRVRRRGAPAAGRVSAAGTPACARGVPVVLERRRTRWRALRRTVTGSDRRFALRLPRRSVPLRVRLPTVTRAPAGETVRCAGVRERIARR